MQSVTPEHVRQALEASKLESVSVDVTSRRATLQVSVINDGSEYRHSLSFEGVSKFRLDRPSTDSWEYVELSEITLEPERGQWRFWAELWDSDALEVISDTVAFDGSRVKPAS